jgi:hypothetical protein
MIRRITQIYEFEEQEDFESLNRGTMDIAKLLIDKLDAKYSNLVEVGLAPCGSTDVTIDNLFYITISDEDIFICQPGECLTIPHQDCVYETVYSILRLML